MQRALGFALGCGLWLATSGAAARPIVYQSCFNDSDCAGAECGGDVCDWTLLNPNAVDPEKPYTCMPAGRGPKGQEGWCTSTNGDDNCKCRDLGAKCVGVYCTFTRPEDAPSAGGSISFAGRTSTAGATGVAGGSSVGGAPARGGEGPVPEPSEMGQQDTESARTSRACAVSIAGRNAGERNLAALAGLAVVLALYCRKRARIPR